MPRWTRMFHSRMFNGRGVANLISAYREITICPFIYYFPASCLRFTFFLLSRSPPFFPFPLQTKGLRVPKKREKGEGCCSVREKDREREREREGKKEKKRREERGGEKKWKSFVEKRRAGPRWLSESFFKMSATASRGEVGGWSGGWLEGSEHGRTGGCAGGRSGWSTPVAKGGKMAAHGKSMEASHCRRPRFHNPQTHPPVPPPTSLQPPSFSSFTQAPAPWTPVSLLI